MAPWAFYCLEKGFQRRKVIWFMTTGLVLALQFFYTHWQIAYYTCLAVGCYGIIRMILTLREQSDEGKKGAYKLIGMNLVTLFFFLSTVAISLLPLSQWSSDTNRGVQSGENAGKGGLNRDEAMSWSLPPEELGAFIVPGLFGFSRQEGGPNPDNILSYYWGRMVFTQTTSYIGLLPWLLLPLSLILRRDRYTLLALVAIVGGIIFSMGKYTFFYNLLFDYFPGINRFRVPKMMMFIPIIGLGVMAARGADILQDEQCRATRAFRRYLGGVIAVPLLLLVFLGSLKLGANYWLSFLSEMIQQPTRYEQGPALVVQRWENMIAEAGIASLCAALYAVTIVVIGRKKMYSGLAVMFLLAIFVADVGRVNAKFMFLTDVPQSSKGIKSPTVDFLSQQSKQYRVLPMGVDPAYLGSHKIPVMFNSMPVQQIRWQEILDTFSPLSVVPDMLNVRYLVMMSEEYNKEKAQLGERYKPVFISPDGREVVLENRNVLPKAWLVPSVFQVTNRGQGLQILQNPAFDPRLVALVESAPPIAMGQKGQGANGSVVVDRYEGKRIDISATTSINSLLVIGEKYYQGWKAFVDGKQVDIFPVNNILRGVYLTPGTHKVGYVFDPLPFAEKNSCVKDKTSLVTQDDLKPFGLQLFQPRQGYRYSLDALLLARFCGELKPGGRIIDLGAGCGIIALVLARINPAASVVAVENNPEMVALVERNIRHNDLAGRVSVHGEDVINLRKSYPVSTFDLVVSNPPFRTAGSGRISPLAGRDAARHETTAGLADFIAAAKYLVKPTGRICFIQLPSRLPEFMALAAQMKLSVLRVRMIHSDAESPATMFMAELAKGRRGAPVVEPPLFVRDMNGGYTDEVWQ